MAKAKKCELHLNTRNGYCLTPIKCESISEAIREAKETKLAYRIIINDKVIKNGWYI
jgi:hypothetical protein